MGDWPVLRRSAGLAASVVLGALAAVPSTGAIAAITSAGARTSAAVSGAAGLAVVRADCVASRHSYDALARKMAADIDRRLSGRISSVGLYETDSRTGITCQYHPARHFYAASVIKVTILSALLRKTQEQHRALTATERQLAWLMITRSDNGAATALWNDVGHRAMQHFLNLAAMRQTELASAWGLSLITAHDEDLLLRLLASPNPVLSKASRVYARYLMANVIPGQRWGVPAGAPRTLRVHVKNGWLPFGGSWEINSIGIFANLTRAYEIVILTYGNPSMTYGINTIENAAVVIHRDLNPGVSAVIPRSKPGSYWGTPDENISQERG